MGDSTLDSELFVLFDRWPGRAERIEADKKPLGGFTGATHHNVGTPQYEAGKKLCVWNDGDTAGIDGMSTFIYLKYAGTGAETLAAKQVCVPASATVWSEVTNDPDYGSAGIVTGSALACVALGVMTDTYWGWFWCGGVVPEALIAALGGDFATEGNVVAGMICTHDLGADAIGLGPVAGDTEASIGFALADDA